MPINNGIIELYVSSGEDGGGITAQIFYNPVLTGGEVVPENQPIRNVNGSALLVTNTTGKTAVVTVDGPAGSKFLGQDGSANLQIPPTGLTATANQLRNQANIQTRADVTNFTLSGPASLR
jgi:hypothetical protein